MTASLSRIAGGLRRFWFPAGLALLVSTSWLRADFSNGNEYLHKQPDGKSVRVRIFGDEHYRRVESPEGYTLVVDPVSGFLSYAKRNAEGTELVSTGVTYTGSTLKAGSTFLDVPKHEALTKAVLLKKAEASRKRQKDMFQAIQKDERAAALATPSFAAASDPLPGNLSGIQYPVIGDLKGLTVLVDFPDLRSKVTRQDMDDFMNKPGYTGHGNNGSVHDYFYDISRGKLNYTNTVVGFYTARHARNWYADHLKDLFDEVFAYLETSDVDVSELSRYTSGVVKGFNILYYGNRADDALWPHCSVYIGGRFVKGVKFAYYQISDLGDVDTGRTPDTSVVVHENGHLLCNWSDAYDSGSESAGTGKWDVMSYNQGKNPQPPNPYYRFLAGWETLTELTPAASGQYQFLFPNSNEDFLYYNYGRTGSHEFFLIESVYKTGRRSLLPGDGMLIWHVDSAGDNDREQMTPSSHYQVAVEQADGRFDLEKKANWGDATDTYKGVNAVFSNTSTPHSKWWSGANSDLSISNINAYGSEFTFQITDTTAPTAPTNLTGYMPRFGYNAQHLSWSPATDQMGVTAYDVYANGTLKGSTAATQFDVWGLRYLTKYEFTVRARDARGNTSVPSTAFTAWTVMDPTMLIPAPTQFRYTGRTFTSVSLAWTAPVGFPTQPNYEVYDASNNLLGATQSTSLTLNNLTPDTTYTLYLLARVSSSAGEVSNACELTVSTLKDTLPPSAPTQLGIYMGGVTMTTASLYWQDSVDNVKVTSYEVYTRNIKLATFPAYRYQVLRNLTPGTTYDLTVVARDAAGNGSAPSNVLTITTPADTSDPTAPTGLGLYMGGVFKTSETTASASLTWKPSTDNSGIREYVLYNQGSQVAVAPPATSNVYFTLPGLPLNTVCAITVRSRDFSGRLSGPSNTLSINTDLTAPTAPTQLACPLGSITTSTADISWQNSSTDNLGVTMYRVLANGKVMGSVTPAPSGTMGYRITKLAPNTVYALSVVALDAAGNQSPKSNQVSITTLPDTTAPSAPTQLGLYMGGVTATTASLRWVASTDDTAVLGYDIYNGQTLFRSIPATDSVVYYSLSNLTPNTTYTLTVRSWNIAGLSSAPSNVLTIKTAAQ